MTDPIKYLTGETFFDSDQEAFYTNLYVSRSKPPIFTAWDGTKELSKQNADNLVELIDTIKQFTTKK